MATQGSSNAVLYGSFTSPFVRHCRYVMTQLEQPFEFVQTDYSQSATGSPLQRVPFMTVGDLKLTDSSSILRYAREQAGQAFLPELSDYDRYAMVNSLLDTAVNLFLLERSGITEVQAEYLGRQKARLETGLAALNQSVTPEQALAKDCHIRCACFVAWAIYRDRLEFSPYPQLLALAETASKDDLFSRTAPPA